MVDNSENILVEFDYNNIIIVDPNKVIDSEGNAKERLLNQEDLVMYANLECKPIPRTKLAIGSDNNDIIRNTSIATINFLKPGGKEFLDNSYTDEITGKDTLKGLGDNQVKIDTFKNPDKDDDFYTRQTLLSGGKQGSVDNGLLGIVSISIKQNTSFTPTITIELQDVKGRALFEGGDNSPYAVFFNLPYPVFYLTIKGFIGKAVRYTLMLENFNSRFDPSTGNFLVTLKMITYKYNVLNEVTMAAALATPHMYSNNLPVRGNEGGPSQSTTVNDLPVQKGTQKIKEMYSEYKSKGLIPDDFPEITIMQMYYRLEFFIKNYLESFIQQNMSPLNDIEFYDKKLKAYQNSVFFILNESWFEKYMDKQNYYVLSPSGIKLYSFKKEFSDPKKKEEAITELKKLIIEYNNALNTNKTLGENGSYEINGKKQKSNIPNNITIDIFFQQLTNPNEINLVETFKQRKGNQEPTTDDLNTLQKELTDNMNFNSGKIILKDGQPVPEYTYYKFGDLNDSKLNKSSRILDKTFLGEIGRMSKDLVAYREKIQDEITKALAEKLQSKSTGLGFIPSARNVMAVIFANGEAFLRLMDDVHTRAWDKRDDKLRKSCILNSVTSSASADNLSSGANKDLPIYPWPQFIVENDDDDNGEEKYVIAYPGDPDYISITKGNQYDIWPEVEFLEEFLRGYTERAGDTKNGQPNFNEETDVKRVSVNGMEFPVTNEIYSNKDEVKFFYEIYERLFYSANYSRLVRATVSNESRDSVASTISDAEKINMLNGLGTDSGFLIEKLKNYGLNSENFVPTLKHISNMGLGKSWQNYIRGIFNTEYIKNQTENGGFQFLDVRTVASTKSNPLISLEDEEKFEKFITGSSETNEFDLLDIYPITDDTWVKEYLANGSSVSDAKTAFNTTKIITYSRNNKTLTNFTNSDDYKIKRPITNFIFENAVIPTANTETDLVEFFETRTYDKQFITEGNIRYIDYDAGVTSNQVNSMLNSPMFINAVQEGVTKQNNGEDYPYATAAYLFINSLPLCTLREKYKTYNQSESNNTTNDLDYILATLKKFSAIHKVPYAWVLKIGSLWYRYKNDIQNNLDILDTVWGNFEYINNFDPINSDPTTTYSLNVNGESIEITLEDDVNFTIGGPTETVINTGFYPKLINDFNTFYQGSEIFNGYTNADIQTGIDSGVNLNVVSEAVIIGGEGFDTGDFGRSLSLTPWSVTIDDSSGSFEYPIPSHGSLLNQTFNECFEGDIDNPKLRIEVSGNYAMYDGSIRALWACPNYGYFDISKLTKPEPNQYIKYINVDSDEQENYSLNGGTIGYDSISEIFCAFDKNALDNFEKEFLNFSQSVNNYKSSTSTEGESIPQKSFKNFQMMMREMMKVPKNQSSESNSTDTVSNIQQSQAQQVNSYLKEFLKYDIVFKLGNPSGFDKKLFYTFSNRDLKDPYSWGKYEENSLPTNGGVVTLSDSVTNYEDAWKALQLYVGFSEIPELEYTDQGSYITDFFVDLNVEFDSKNIENLAPIIKIYATQKLNQIESTGTFTPPANSEFPGDILQIVTLNNDATITIYKKNRKKFAVLRDVYGSSEYTGEKVDLGNPTDNTEIINQSIESVYSYVSQNSFDAQYITNIETLPTPQFPTVPDSKSKWGNVTLVNLMDEYLNNVDSFQSDTVNNLMLRMRSALANVNSSQNNLPKPSELDGKQTKVELWESFKATNDKWIAGANFKEKTLFEDLLLLDRASRNVGDKVLIDIFKLKEKLVEINPKMTVFTFFQSILIENNFVIMNMPSYVNFYNVQDAGKNTKPKPEGTLEFGNTLFGTFLNVDFRESSAKMVCLYSNKPSEHVDLKNNIDYRFRDDAFDLRRASDNPLVENQTNKNDWDKSNKVVGFNVDIGPQNQSIFRGFEVSQDAGKATAESLQVINSMANQAGNRGGATQSTSLYNIYKNRSYSCKLSMLGNALIQPTMYFNLRYVPMFSGPYMILEVNHIISPGIFDTQVTGIRQPTAALPKVDQFIQTLKANLIKKIQDRIKQESDNSQEIATNVKTQSQQSYDNLSTNPANSFSENQSCSANTKYSQYLKEEPVKSTATSQEVYDVVGSASAAVYPNDPNLFTQLLNVVFTKIYMSSFVNPNFETYNNNFAGIDITEWWGPSSSRFKVDGNGNGLYYCTSNNRPYASFENLQESVVFLVERWKNRFTVGQFDDDTELAKFIFLNSIPGSSEVNTWDELSETQRGNLVSEATAAINLLSQL
jgi:hypothetical protein